MRTLLTLAILCAAGRAEIIDRIAVTVDSRVITESGILREIRITALLNGAKPDFSPQSRREAANRLVEQAIIAHEMEITRFPTTQIEEIRGMLQQVKQDLFGGNDAAYRTALKSYGVTELLLERHLARQATTLKFLELRFRPEVQLSETEVRDYYDSTFLPAWKKDHPGEEASFDELRPEAEEALAQQRADKLVDKWVQEARQRLEIRYREGAFQ